MEIKPLLPPVTVNGMTIDPGRIAAEAQNHHAPKGKPGLAWKAAARALAIRELLLQQAASAGLVADPAEIAPGQWETREEALIRQLLDQAVVPALADETTLRALYEARPDHFRSPSLYEAAHILFAAAPDDAPTRETARKAATEVMAQARREPRRFAELAARHSACSSRGSGGLLGQLVSGDTVPEFEAALAAMPEGGIALCETRYGIHVLRLDARAEGRVLPFEVVRPQLAEASEKSAWLRASRAYVETLIAAADVCGIDLQP